MIRSILYFSLIQFEANYTFCHSFLVLKHLHWLFVWDGASKEGPAKEPAVSVWLIRLEPQP